MARSALKLVSSDVTDSDTLRFEQRQTRRHALGGRVTSVQNTVHPTSFDSSNRISSLQLLNISDSGLGALVQEPIEPGSSIAIFFPAHGPEQGFDRHGYIVRCVPVENGYQIGIRFHTRSAA